MADVNHFAEHLAELASAVPDEAAVLALHEQPEVHERSLALAHRLAESLGWKVREERRSQRRATRVLRDPEHGRLTLFHGSGAVSVRAGVQPFDELFDDDPGDRELTRHVTAHFDRLPVRDLLSEGNSSSSSGCGGFAQQVRTPTAGSAPRSCAGRWAPSASRCETCPSWAGLRRTSK